MLSHKTSSRELLLHGGNKGFNAMPVLQFKISEVRINHKRSGSDYLLLAGGMLIK